MWKIFQGVKQKSCLISDRKIGKNWRSDQANTLKSHREKLILGAEIGLRGAFLDAKMAFQGRQPHDWAGAAQTMARARAGRPFSLRQGFASTGRTRRVKGATCQ
jgi:hypothetical protein